MSVSSSSWGLGRVAVCDCGTPWTFLLLFFISIPLLHKASFHTASHPSGQWPDVLLHEILKVTERLIIIVAIKFFVAFCYKILCFTEPANAAVTHVHFCICSVCANSCKCFFLFCFFFYCFFILQNTLIQDTANIANFQDVSSVVVCPNNRHGISMQKCLNLIALG